MKPDSWPTGASEAKVRDCNCPTCNALIEQLEANRENQSKDGEHKPLNVYTE